MRYNLDDIYGGFVRRFRRAEETYRRFVKRFVAPIRITGSVLYMLSVIASVVLLACMVLVLGFEHGPSQWILLSRSIHAAQTIFLINIVFSLLFERDAIRKEGSTLIRWIVCIGVLLTAWPLIYPRPDHPWIPWAAKIIYSNRFIYPVLIAYSIVDLCHGVMKLIGRRTNPSLLMSGSFIVLIFIGTLLLMLPKSTYAGITFTDALFVSTSAVCITGLTPVDIYVNFTPLGVLILSLLIQIGGLGVMTFTSFFALFFSGRASIYSQLMLKDMIYSNTMSALVPTLLYILGFTMTIEAIGAVMVFFCVHGQLGLPVDEELVFCAFHSLSSFCNAGFSTLPGGMGNVLLMTGNGSIYWVTSLLVVLGAIGFPILVNFKDAIFLHVRNLLQAIGFSDNKAGPRNVHPYNMNTKIVLTTYGILFVAGAILFYLMERTNTLQGMSGWDQLTQSVFNSVTPRSAGFSSVNPAAFRPATVLMVMFLMWVGGASQSTAGGIKVNTLAAICLNLRAIVLGRERVTAFKRSIAVWSIRRANSVVALSIFSYLIYSLILLTLEPDLPARDVLFEVLSALFTVGSSLGITGDLSDTSSLILCTAMFLGRVGLISLIVSIVGQKQDVSVSMPSDNLIIN